MSDQSQWRFCHKCAAMFFNGFPSKGRCPTGGAHEAAGFNFVLPHDVPDSQTAQQQWRFCHKCARMFFNGFPSKGSCPAGGANEAAGFNFVLPHVDPNNATFDSGNLTTPGGLTLNGSVHIVMRRNGDFAFSSHAHDSGFDNIDYVVSAVVMTTTGIPFTFQHEGHVEGTIAGLPFGKPKRDDNFDMSGHNPMISREFDGMDGAVLVASVDGIDTLVGGLKRALEDLLKEAGDELKKAATAAVVALVVA